MWRPYCWQWSALWVKVIEMFYIRKLILKTCLKWKCIRNWIKLGRSKSPFCWLKMTKMNPETILKVLGLSRPWLKIKRPLLIKKFRKLRKAKKLSLKLLNFKSNSNILRSRKLWKRRRLKCQIFLRKMLSKNLRKKLKLLKHSLKLKDLSVNTRKRWKIKLRN